MAEAGQKYSAPDYEKGGVCFRAQYLSALEPIIRASQDSIDCWSVGGLIIEPVEAGGCVLVATDGHILAAIFDATAKATRPMRLTISDDLFAAVKPPAGIVMHDQGDTFEMPLPEWAQPGLVYAWGLSAFVYGQMSHPSFEEDEGGLLGHVRAEHGNVYEGGYRIHKEPPTVAWRSILAKPRTAPDGRVSVYPHVITRFERIERLFAREGKGGIEFSFGGEGEPAFLTAPGAPEFIGAMMPSRTPIEAPALPAWALVPAAANAPIGEAFPLPNPPTPSTDGREVVG